MSFSSTAFSSEIEEPKDVSSRCDIAIEVRRKLPNCRVYLICEDGYPEKLPALNKAVELKLIDGYCIGDLAAEQMRTWLSETAETISGRERPVKTDPAAASRGQKRGKSTNLSMKEEEKT